MKDKRSITAAINGKKGGRPRELKDWDGGKEGETWKPHEMPDRFVYFISSLGRLIRIKKGAIRLVKTKE